MPQDSIAVETSASNLFSIDERQSRGYPEVLAVAKGLTSISTIIMKNENFLSLHPYITHSLTSGRSVWEFRQYEIPDHKYGTRSTDRKWTISFSDSTSPEQNFTLSVITVARNPDSRQPFPVQPEIRIKLPLSEEEIKSEQYALISKNIGICMGLRLPSGDITREDGGNPENIQQMRERACLVVDTFITYLNSLLPKKPLINR